MDIFIIFIELFNTKLNLMKKILLLCCLLTQAIAAFSTTYTVKSEAEFKEKVTMLQAGDKIKIANGTYRPWTVTIPVSGTAAAPVYIEAETKGKVIFTGATDKTIFKITGNFVVLKGITFKGCTVFRSERNAGILVEMDKSEFSRLTECRFEQDTAKSQFLPLVVIAGKGKNNQVDNCLFSQNVDNMDVQVRVSKESTPQYTLIEKNIFQDKKKVSWSNYNGGECVQIGQDPVLSGNIPSNSIVRSNRFLRCSAEPEVISNKSSNNLYENNYIEDCESELVMRGGYDCTVINNTIKGGLSGIRVNGGGHVISGNKITGVKTAIRLMYGMTKTRDEIGFYVAANNCTIKNNKIENVATGILIGDSKNADWTGKFDTKRYPSRTQQDVAPYNITVEHNSFSNVQNKIVEN